MDMKKIKKEINSHNIFYYVGAFFLIVIFTIVVMGGYLYRFYYKAVYSDFLNQNSQRLSAIVSRHENDIQIVDDIVIQMSLSVEGRSFKLEEQPQKAGKLKEQLKQYTAVSQFFNMLLYQYHRDEYIFNDSTSLRTDYFLQNGCLMEQVQPEELKELMMEETMRLRILPEQAVDGIWINYYLANKDKVFFFRAIPPLCEETLIFMVPDTYYDKLLVSEEKDKRMDFLCYDGKVVVARGNEMISEEELYGLLPEMREGSCKVQVNGVQYLLSAMEGDSGILYGSLQSMSIFHDKFMSSQWGIIFVMLICAIPATFVIVVLSDKILKRVKNLNLLLNDEANYDFESIENGIQTLLTSRTESEKERLSLKKTRFIRDFIRGGFPQKSDVILAAEKVGLVVDYRQFLVLLIRGREMSHENKAYSDMLEIIERKSKVEGYGIHLINNNQNLFVLFADEQEELESVLDVILEIERKYCQDYVIAVSNYHDTFEESSKAYLEASTAFDSHLLFDSNNIIRFSEVVQKDYIGRIPGNYLQRLRYAIQNNDKKGMRVAVKDICSQMNGENASLYAFRILYNDIIHVLLSEWPGDKNELNDFYNVFTLSKCLNMQDFYELLCEACEVIIDRRSGIAVKNSDVIEEAATYMRTNFSDSNLTMSTLAEHLHISTVTLSIEFKNEMDVSPSDYLANLRMEKAKELLRDTNMLVREISVAVGYEDAHVFMRRFKKYAGMTPGQYRSDMGD